MSDKAAISARHCKAIQSAAQFQLKSVFRIVECRFLNENDICLLCGDFGILENVDEFCTEYGFHSAESLSVQKLMGQLKNDSNKTVTWPTAIEMLEGLAMTANPRKVD